MDIDDLTRDSYLADLSARPMDDVRSMRADVQAHENAASFLRRMVQGRLDLVGSELGRRRRQEPPQDLAELVEGLSGVMGGSDSGDGRQFLGRPPQDLTAADIDHPLQEELDEILPPSRLVEITQLDEAGLESLTESLSDLEERVSAQRRQLHSVIDALQAEITRRYRTGEADVNSLLN